MCEEVAAYKFGGCSLESIGVILEMPNVKRGWRDYALWESAVGKFLMAPTDRSIKLGLAM